MNVPLHPEQSACVRRLSRRAMDVLDRAQTWTGPMGQIAAQAAIMRAVEALVRAGERDEIVILDRVLDLVCGGRLSTGALVPRAGFGQARTFATGPYPTSGDAA